MTRNQFIELLAECAFNLDMDISEKVVGRLADQFKEENGGYSDNVVVILEFLEGEMEK